MKQTKNQCRIDIQLTSLSNRVFWAAVSEPITLNEAQSRYEHYKKQYPKNRYKIVALP